MILVINHTTEIRFDYAKEVITFTPFEIDYETKIDIEGNVLQTLEDLFSTDTISIIVKADDDSELTDYSRYSIDRLEQSIHNDIITTSIILHNTKSLYTDEVVVNE